MIGWMDVALVVLFAAVWPLLEYFVLWPRHVRAVDSDDPHARSRTYTRTLFEEWALAAAVFFVMWRGGRPLSVLGLVMPHGWRLWLGFTLPAVYALLIVIQTRA